MNHVERDGPSPAERKTLDAREAEVLAMLRQIGGPTALSELSEAVSMSLDDIANLLDGLDGRKLIEWQFDEEKRAYFVCARSLRVQVNVASSAPAERSRDTRYCCQVPDRLRGKPEECSAEQIHKCHDAPEEDRGATDEGRSQQPSGGTRTSGAEE